jgi:PQQ-like domain
MRKYDSRGNELWTREFCSGGCSATLLTATADASGVYVLRTLYPSGAPSQVVLSKYNPGGNELWTRQLDFGGPFAVAADATGVYVSGRDFPPNHSYLRKYAADGVELWTSRSGDSLSQEIPLAVAVDGTGVYVTGQREEPYGGFIRKSDSLGNQLWTRQLDWEALRIAAADSAGLYAVVLSAGASFVRRYDAGGNEVWSRQIAPFSAAGGLLSVAADATGVYVAGTTSLGGRALSGQCRSGSGGDSFVRRYASMCLE